MKLALRLAWLASFAVASQGAHAQTPDVVQVVNRLRSAGGACAATAAPLLQHNALDAAASELSRGASLDSALKSSGYRMTQVQVITLGGDGLRARLEKLLAGRFCAQIGNPKFSDAGVYEGANKMWIVLAAPFAPKVGLTPEEAGARMLTLVNQARAEPRNCGGKAFAAARPVGLNGVLEKVAALHATDMAENNYFSHTGRDGLTPAQRVARAGYRYRMTGENIAAGQLAPEQAVAGWIRSPGHCANLMNGGHTEMGVAFAVSTSSKMGVYWVQLFGTPR